MRLSKIDALRGLTLISMIAYHLVWDLVHIYGSDLPWYRSLPGFIWQQSICCTFILLSGFSMNLGHRHLKRGIVVFLSGALVTLITLFFMPENVVWFGILTFMGTAMLIMIPVDGILKNRPRNVFPAVLVVSLLLFIITRDVNRGQILGLLLPDPLYAGYLTAFLGFPFPGFYSTDYFSVIPWIFLYLAGYASYRVLPEKCLPFLSESICPPLEYLGRHTLIIYLLHQPVIYGVTSLVFRS